jgi:SAM-dependent methyltransferase
MRTPALANLIDTASAKYRSAGRFAYYFARGKLGHDPIFAKILALGLLPHRARILDLGCGQGLLAAWLLTARDCYCRKSWPEGWPVAPEPALIRGIELMAQDVERARCALGPSAEFIAGDIRDTDFGTADAIAIIDVLQYMDYPAQMQILSRARSALAPGGLLLLRVGDAGGGLRFRIGTCVDQAVMLARRRRPARLHCFSIQAWQQMLTRCGLSGEAVPMSPGTPFANVLLIARPQ